MLANDVPQENSGHHLCYQGIIHLKSFSTKQQGLSRMDVSQVGLNNHGWWVCMEYGDP